MLVGSLYGGCVDVTGVSSNAVMRVKTEKAFAQPPADMVASATAETVLLA